jgi:hypothetical protein
VFHILRNSFLDELRRLDNLEFVNQPLPDNPEEMAARVALNRLFLRAALSIAGGMSSSAAATRVAGNEAARLKAEIAHLEAQLQPGEAAAAA